MNPGPTAARVDTHVHVRVGRCHIAIPIAQVCEALPMPPAGLTPLPRRADALLGLIAVDGAPVPVVALERWLPIGRDTDATVTPRLLVLRHGEGRVALQVDAVLGVKTAPAGTVRQIYHNDDADELFQTVIPGVGDRPELCLLEVARLMRLSQAWCAGTDGPVAHPPVASTPSDVPVASLRVSVPTQRYGVFRIGDECWAVPVGAVERVTAVPLVELALASGRRSWAICEWQGRKLPLVDISAARGASSREAAPWMVQLSQGSLSLGLTVSACLQFVDLPADACAAMPDDDLLGGIAVLPDLGKLRVLDPGKLFHLTPEISISRQVPVEAKEPGNTHGPVAEPMPYLVFEADQRYASPVEGIVGVVELPHAAREDLRNGEAAVLQWRDRTLRVVNLPSLTGHAGDAARFDPRLAVLVQPTHSAAQPLGIAIRQLSDWLPAHSTRRSGVRMGNIGSLSMIDAPGAPENASLVVVDLAQMAYLLD